MVSGVCGTWTAGPMVRWPLNERVYKTVAADPLDRSIGWKHCIDRVYADKASRIQLKAQCTRGLHGQLLDDSIQACCTNKCNVNHTNLSA